MPEADIRADLRTILRRGAVLAAPDGSRTPAAELDEDAGRVAAGLAAWGVRPGDRAALLAPHTHAWFVAHLALARLGVLTVPITTRLAAPEITDLVRATGCRLLVVDADFLDLEFGRLATRLVDAGLLDRVVTTAPAAVPGARTLAELRGDTPAPADVDGDTPLICFGTSGTTGAPKLAVHTHAGVARHAEAVARALRLGPDDVVLGVLPPCGAYGYTVAFAALAAGARFVPLTTFTPADLLAEVDRHGATFLGVTEAILRAALGPDRPATPSWRLGASAGGSLADVAAALEPGGTRLVNVYGASEALALVALRDPAAPVAERAAAGGTLVDPRAEVRAVAPGTDEALAPGEVGELCFRGPSVFTGYLDDDRATTAARTADGWYRSGDSGRVHDGGRTFDYLSRLADTLRLKGFLVDPAQIEEALLGHPEVREAAVVGVGDPATGEDRAVAFVVGGPGEDALRAWCRERLAAFKVPSRIERLDAIPVTPSANGDKALKRALRERALTLSPTKERP
jgi:fatty-acyl-CoA synthase